VMPNPKPQADPQMSNKSTTPLFLFFEGGVMRRDRGIYSYSRDFLPNFFPAFSVYIYIYILGVWLAPAARPVLEATGPLPGVQLIFPSIMITVILYYY